MKKFFRPLLGLAAGAIISGCSHGASGVTPAVRSSNQLLTSHSANHVPYAGALRSDGSAEVCAPPRFGEARCLALVRLDTPLLGEGTLPDSIPGFHPADLRSAYKQTTTGGAGQTIAIVDAYDDPKAESDLNVYRHTFGIPPCTTANHCFRKVNQNGQPHPLPPIDQYFNWAFEISLDVDVLSAICPNCHILLIEANDSSFPNLSKAVDRAAIMGAAAISNSYGGDEEYGFRFNSHYHHPHHIVLASSGDGGFGVGFPESSQYVVAVGGTTLTRSGGARGWSETVWSGAGSGCALLAPKPSWQHDTGCSMRTVADAAAVADPATGVAIYDTFQLYRGWNVAGGTSVSSPLLAGIYGLAGNATTLNRAQSLYVRHTSLFDVTSGSNGTCTPPSSHAYLCHGEPGFDGPTGNGTPNGLGAF
jgi:hypothetical protein